MEYRHISSTMRKIVTGFKIATTDVRPRRLCCPHRKANTFCCWRIQYLTILWSFHLTASLGRSKRCHCFEKSKRQWVVSTCGKGQALSKFPMCSISSWLGDNSSNWRNCTNIGSEFTTIFKRLCESEFRVTGILQCIVRICTRLPMLSGTSSTNTWRRCSDVKFVSLQISRGILVNLHLSILSSWRFVNVSIVFGILLKLGRYRRVNILREANTEILLWISMPEQFAISRFVRTVRWHISTGNRRRATYWSLRVWRPSDSQENGKYVRFGCQRKVSSRMFSKLRVRRDSPPERAVLFRVRDVRQDICEVFLLQTWSISGQFKSIETHVEIFIDSRDNNLNIASDVIIKFGKFINVKCLSCVSIQKSRGSFLNALFIPNCAVERPVPELPLRTSTWRFDRPQNQDGIVVKAVLNTCNSWISPLISCRSSGNSKSPFGSANIFIPCIKVWFDRSIFETFKLSNVNAAWTNGSMQTPLEFSSFDAFHCASRTELSTSLNLIVSCNVGWKVDTCCTIGSFNLLKYTLPSSDWIFTVTCFSIEYCWLRKCVRRDLWRRWSRYHGRHTVRWQGSCRVSNQNRVKSKVLPFRGKTWFFFGGSNSFSNLSVLQFCLSSGATMPTAACFEKQ